ncbi:GNAT family N-acetyltransferase [Bradyrhizobium sp. LHD-71]|uniref:GNAT family N-acetyltransferase n=1 Tax=Bradyrhizobium sp. LHD-71 TaxID=3072141 RepID=UPI00280FE917|nr:GNAT family N-acetyltransferase [Bradyrhizobium sp. LHD-71]MDQ8730382.1 GNAT family N-acetyltransferase [Bradyrhizobium sp. LHD-71]
MPVEIVRIGTDHIEGFHRALDIVARERRYLAFLEAPPIERVRAFVLGNIEHGYPQYVILSADGDVSGWCDILPMTSGPTHRHRGVLGMGLLPQFRGQGIGATLLQAALCAARDFGLHRVELTVRQGNERAIALYRSAGFEREGEQKDAIRIDGVYENLIGMAKLFQRPDGVTAACRNPRRCP